MGKHWIYISHPLPLALQCFHSWCQVKCFWVYAFFPIELHIARMSLKSPSSSWVHCEGSHVYTVPGWQCVLHMIPIVLPGPISQRWIPSFSSILASKTRFLLDCQFRSCIIEESAFIFIILLGDSYFHLMINLIRKINLVMDDIKAFLQLGHVDQYK